MTRDPPTSSSDRDDRPLVILLDDDEQRPAACAALRAAGWREVEPSKGGSSSSPGSTPTSGAAAPAEPSDPIRAVSGRDGAVEPSGGDGSPAAAVPPERGIVRAASEGHAIGRGPAPRGPGEGHDYVLATVDGPAGAAAVLAEVIAGRGAVVTPTSARVVWVRFVRALADVAEVHRWSASPLAGLDDIQIGILVALGSGESVRVAARTTGVSARSAHRQLSRARDLLGVTANGAAAAIVVKALAELS